MISVEEDIRTLHCGNLTPEADEEILHELFLQAGPLEKIVVPKDSYGNNRGFAFIVFKHECSVPYAIELFRDTSLFGQLLRLNTRRSNANHHRSYSAPANFNQLPPVPSLNFDELLAKSQSIHMNNSHPASPWRSVAPESCPPNQSRYMKQPPPPGVHFGSDDQMTSNINHDGEENGNLSRSSLSRSSLQGNWSARNSSYMPPRRLDHSRRSEWDFRAKNDHERNYTRDRNDDHIENRSTSRRDNFYDRNDDRHGQSHNFYDRNDDRHGQSHSRERNNRYYNSDRNRKDGYRHRSGDSHDRRGRY